MNADFRTGTGNAPNDSPPVTVGTFPGFPLPPFLRPSPPLRPPVPPPRTPSGRIPYGDWTPGFRMSTITLSPPLVTQSSTPGPQPPSPHTAPASTPSFFSPGPWSRPHLPISWSNNFYCSNWLCPSLPPHCALPFQHSP